MKRAVTIACRLAVAAAAAALFAAINAAAAGSPPPVLFYASQSGKPTIDQGEGGGNPFASALVELLSHRDLTLKTLPSELSKLTIRKSDGFQSPDISPLTLAVDWKFQPKPATETRVALVVAFSDYSASGGAPSLPGAKHDAARIASAVTAAGFATETVVDPGTAELRDILARFAARSAAADIAIVYATGHGVEVDGSIYLLPGNYPVMEGNAALEQNAVRLTEFVSAAHATFANLVFYAGCRDNPFATN